jgi:hypothetical protein
MKTRIVLSLLAIVLVFSMTGCSSSSPSSVVKNFYKYTINEEYEKAASLFSQSAIDQFGIAKIEMIIQQQNEILMSMGGIQNFEVVDETIIEDNAMVQVKITFADGQEETDTVNLVKEDGKWKIDLGK